MKKNVTMEFNNITVEKIKRNQLFYAVSQSTHELDCSFFINTPHGIVVCNSIKSIDHKFCSTSFYFIYNGKRYWHYLEDKFYNTSKYPTKIAGEFVNHVVNLNKNQ